MVEGTLRLSRPLALRIEPNGMMMMMMTMMMLVVAPNVEKWLKNLFKFGLLRAVELEVVD